MVASLFARQTPAAPAFNPASLFAAGELGLWWDPSDLTTVFEDAAGTIPASVNGVVGRINDKSGRGMHGTQNTTSSKPVLRLSGGFYYLEFDGIDDWLETPSMDFSSINKLTMTTGIRRTSDAATSIALEFSNNVNNNPGSFRIAAPIGNGTSTYDIYSRGTVLQNITTALYSSATKVVLTDVADIGAPSLNLRGQGASISTVTGSQGTGNYGNYPFYAGRRGGASLPFTGFIFQLIIRGVISNPTELTNTETWVNGKTGAY